MERYLSYIGQFDIEFEHRPGKNIPGSDYLSRGVYCDDEEVKYHMNKPFDPRELQARVEVLLRRS